MATTKNYHKKCALAAIGLSALTILGILVRQHKKSTSEGEADKS